MSQPSIIDDVADIPVCHSAKNFKSSRSSPYALHGVPTKVKSAVKLLSERCKLLALYPEQLSVFFYYLRACPLD
jgi:hypothetical protein